MKVIPKSSSRQRLEENLSVLKFVQSQRSSSSGRGMTISTDTDSPSSSSIPILRTSSIPSESDPAAAAEQEDGTLNLSQLNPNLHPEINLPQNFPRTTVQEPELSVVSPQSNLLLSDEDMERLDALGGANHHFCWNPYNIL